MLTPAAADEVAAAADDRRDKDRHRGELAALLLALLGIYSGHVYSEIGVTPPTASLSEISWAQGRAASLLDVVNATTRRQLLQALSEAKPGEDLDTTLARIDKVFDRAETLRAPIIGDSTATALGGFAAYNVALHTGIQRVIWTTMRDPLVRDSHVVLDGQARHPGELFTSGLGNQAYYPGAFGEAADDCGCRCWLEVELADNDKAAPQRRLELADARESIRQLAAQQIIGRMLAIFRDQRARVIAAARRLDV